MPSKQITEHLAVFLQHHPLGNASDFANYIRTIQEIEEL